jgi:hypothetical protein
MHVEMATELCRWAIKAMREERRICRKGRERHKGSRERDSEKQIYKVQITHIEYD